MNTKPTMRIAAVKVINETHYKPIRVYIHPKDESVMDNFCNRHNRPYELYRGLLPTILREAGVSGDTKARWSQKAGCSCGCSPAFILSDCRGSFSIHATVTMTL